MSLEWYRYKKIVIDTGPLLLYLVGFYRIKDLEHFGYKDRDLLLLNEFLKNFSEILVTPHVLAEMSDLAESRLNKRFSSFMFTSFDRLYALGEEYITKNEILGRKNCVSKFGIADVASIGVSEKNILFLTADGPLYYYCKSIEIPVIHLNELDFLILGH